MRLDSPRLTRVLPALLLSGVTAALFGIAPSATPEGKRSETHRPAQPPGQSPRLPVPDGVMRARINDTYARLPLTFEANIGQVDRKADFVARGPGYVVFLTPSEAVLSLAQQPREGNARNEHAKSQSAVVRMKVTGGNRRAQATPVEELPGKVNYLIGRDPKRWHRTVPTFRKVIYQDVYAGVDLAYYGNQQQLEYDFIVRPGASPDTIRLRFEGLKAVSVNTDGDLVLRTSEGEIRQAKPRMYQEVRGQRLEISGGYVVDASSEVRFEVGSYDRSRPLIIDLVLVYSTYLGGASIDAYFFNDFQLGIAVDATGSAYVTGFTLSANFPTTAGAFDTSLAGNADVFVTKLNPSGSAPLVYSTYLGGTNRDQGNSIAVDVTGSAYVTGHTESTDFPTTPGAFDTTHNGDRDAFMTKLSSTGSALTYSTYLGGNTTDEGKGLAIDTAGSAYVTGSTASADFPTTPGAFDVTRSPLSEDAFVTKITPTGSLPLAYSTYLGGSGGDRGHGIALDVAGNAYVTGWTESDDFPTTPGAFDTTHNGIQDAFVTKLNAIGSAPLLYSTYLGGTSREEGTGLRSTISIMRT
jgi:hypothetical protein